MSSSPFEGGRRRGGQALPVRRNIQLTPELISMGVTELVVQDYNLMMQIRRNDDEAQIYVKL